MNLLKKLYPEIALQWHLTKNIGLVLDEIQPKSNKKIWWKCSYGHEWQASVYNRTRGKGCPYCAGYYPSPEHNLAICYPELLLEWDYAKNLGIDPTKVNSHTEILAWWICIKKHNWQTKICNRTDKRGGTGCPICKRQTSQIEMRVYSELKYFYPDAEWQDEYYSVEVDVLLPKEKIAIEVDGSFWHKNKLEKDTIKSELLKKNGLTVIRVREQPLVKLGCYDILFKKKENHLAIIQRLVLELYSLTNKSNLLDYSSLQNTDLYQTLLSNQDCPKISIFDRRPELASQWDYTKNIGINPKYCSFGTETKVWWKCTKGHEWEALVSSRGRGRDCPYCCNRLVGQDNNLLYLYPEIAKQWHPTLNGNLLPSEVSLKSGKKVWWVCKFGHEWKTNICVRTVMHCGCPYCAGQKKLPKVENGK